MENKKLNEFLELCKTDKDLHEIKHYSNSVVVSFNEVIYSVLTEKLKTLPNNFFISLRKNIIDDKITINVFIYKVKIYDYD
jgi:hypothetical protein